MTRDRVLWRCLELASLLAAWLSLSNCVHVVRPHRHVTGRVVAVEAGHVHTHACGHYRHAGRWYLLPAHVHGPRCGHAFARGVWVLVP